ncbi:hypothetical protein I3842_14G008100 [Carya illinoinensis]|uniref:Uncharacterized protein n=1 Tax=Carya illinoinensis TaxID=32201 RepID=A0A922AFJ9_CARIL|nr:hypothetical protein I3842_14G008100 [Carya illinoinensis]
MVLFSLSLPSLLFPPRVFSPPCLSFSFFAINGNEISRILHAEPILSDLCLGKPALRSLPISATVADAFAALKNTDDNFISVWDCVDHSAKVEFGHDNVGVGCECRCVGKVCMVDVICYLCRDENLFSPSAALKAPVSASSKNIVGSHRSDSARSPEPCGTDTNQTKQLFKKKTAPKTLDHRPYYHPQRPRILLVDSRGRDPVPSRLHRALLPAPGALC